MLRFRCNLLLLCNPREQQPRARGIGDKGDSERQRYNEAEI